MTGNGYAPKFTVTSPKGQQRTGLTQWQTVSPQTMLSQGATKFDPPRVHDETERRQKQLAITGLFTPTASDHGGLVTSTFPDTLNPKVTIDVLEGELGTDSGRGQPIFGINQSMVDSGRLHRMQRTNLGVGQDVRLPDGTDIRFDGAQWWVNLQVAHDPFEMWVLACAIAITGGLSASLNIKRRRIWVAGTATRRPVG